MEIETTDGNASTVLSIKRKADEAFDALDEALQVRPKEIRRSPVKKANVSFYSSLSRHGIETKPKTKPSVSVPTLSALLNRARSRKDIKPPSLIQHHKTSSATPEYSPGSTEVFLERLSTFNVSTYPSKPQPIDAVAAAMAGWVNEGGRNRLFCSICHAAWIVTGREGLSKEAADALVEKQASCLTSNHKEGCPWRTRQCDPLVYRIPLQSPATMAKQIKELAEQLEPFMEGITIRHPLSMSQVNSFVQAITAAASKSASSVMSESDHEKTSGESTVKIPSATSLLAALFGWALVSLPVPIIRKPSAVSLAQARNQSLSRAGSVTRSTAPSREVTPAPTVEPSSHSLPSTPVASRTRPTPFALPSTPSSISIQRSSIKDATLQCKMCQRRIGLWAFTTAATDSPDSPYQPNGARPSQRQLDLVREHRSYCPYVVKSTPLATLPLYDSTSQPNPSFTLTRTDTSISVPEKSGAGFQKPALLRSATIFSTGRSNSGPLNFQNSPLVEGWRAVFNTILRYGISERAGMTVLRHVPSPEPTPDTEVDEDDAMRGVSKIVEDVKRHGGKQILAYVRNLLG